MKSLHDCRRTARAENGDSPSIADRQDELQWDDLLKGTQSNLIAKARQAKQQVAEGLSRPINYSFRNRQVRHSDFQIGTEFFTETGKWRCTDVGTRVIVAISLEPREMIRSHEGADGRRIEEHFVSDDPRDLVGPPYMVAEHVFDEYSIEGCYASEDEV